MWLDTDMTTTTKFATRLRNNTGTGWITGNVGRFTVQAKVYDEGSHYGIDGGRVSKLWIKDGAEVVYNYDRGLDFSTIADADLATIIAAVTK